MSAFKISSYYFTKVFFFFPLKGFSFLVFFSYVSAKLRNALPDFIRTSEFTGFKRESSAAFCTAAFLFNWYIFKYSAFSMYLYMPCILAVNAMSRRY